MFATLNLPPHPFSSFFHFSNIFRFFIRPKSDHGLALSVSPSVTGLVEFCSNRWICQSCYMDISKLLHGFVRIFTWICQNFYMEFSKLYHGCVSFDTWISLSYYMDLSKLRHGFVKVVLSAMFLPKGQPSLLMVDMR